MRKSHFYEKSSEREVIEISIRTQRKAKGWTQKELAEKLNVDQSAITLWEKQRNGVRMKYLLEMAKIFGCTIDDLLKDDGEEIGEGDKDVGSED